MEWFTGFRAITEPCQFSVVEFDIQLDKVFKEDRLCYAEREYGFKELDYDVNRVFWCSFESMFDSASAFQGDVTSWTLNTISPVSMRFMFRNTVSTDLNSTACATSFELNGILTHLYSYSDQQPFNEDISGWVR